MEHLTIQTASSAMSTNKLLASASEWTATVAIPIFLHVLITRTAISPRLAINIFSNGFYIFSNVFFLIFSFKYP